MDGHTGWNLSLFQYLLGLGDIWEYVPEGYR